MDFLDEGEAVERANVELREEMLRYNVITDSDDRYALAHLLIKEDRKMIVPVYIDENDPDGLPLFATMYKHEKAVELHVYTSCLYIPPECPAENVSFYPFLDLLDGILANGEVSIMRIDSGSEHGVGVFFKDGELRIFRLKRMEDYIAGTGSL
ncbi:MAG: hypothetical protein ABI432_04130 [Flavobacteriales bacterium]